MLVNTFPGVFAQDVPSADALARWEHFREEVNESDLQAVAEQVRLHTARGDRRAVQRLTNIARDPQQPLRSRVVAIEIVCEVASTEEDVRVIVEMMRMYLAALRVERPTGLHEPGALLHSFVLSGAAKLIAGTSEHQSLLTFFKDCYLSPRVGPEARSASAALIVGCKAPLRSRQEAVLDILRRDRPGSAHHVFFSVLDDSVLPELREIVKNGNSPETFNYAAADALSYLGDEEILPELKARREVFGNVHRAHRSTLDRFIFRIEMQHPPTNLLAYIGSADFRGDREMRMWAVRRAHELGVEHELIREAILKHARDAATPLERGELPNLKWMGRELGILRENDLPEVEYGPEATP